MKYLKKGTNNEINYIFEVDALSSTTHLFTNQQTFAIILCCVTCTNNDNGIVTSYLNFVLDTMNWTDLETIVFDETCFSVLKNMSTNLRYLYLTRLDFLFDCITLSLRVLVVSIGLNQTVFLFFTYFVIKPNRHFKI